MILQILRYQKGQSCKVNQLQVAYRKTCSTKNVIACTEYTMLLLNNVVNFASMTRYNYTRQTCLKYRNGTMYETRYTI